MSVAAIIPAYNEEKTIADVIQVVRSHPVIDQIIVVSDGSEDGTAVRARAAGAEVIELEENRGKGGALKVGINNTDAEYILFLDADLVGLKKSHLERLLQPVISGETDMTIGIFDHGRLATDLAHKIAPHLSGQRALRHDILDDLFQFDEVEYGIETLLTRRFQKKGYSHLEISLPDLTHVMKEEKMGFFQGFAQRLKMFWQIAKNLFRRV